MLEKKTDVINRFTFDSSSLQISWIYSFSIERPPKGVLNLFLGITGGGWSICHAAYRIVTCTKILMVINIMRIDIIICDLFMSPIRRVLPLFGFFSFVRLFPYNW